MPKHWGLGPVFAFEWRIGARRWQGYALRSSAVLVLLAAMTLVWWESTDTGPSATIQQQSEVGRAFYGTTATILLGLVGLAAPAATAGSICLDKARGNLALLFATDLSNREIVFGKLAARLVPVFGLILCCTPVLAIATLFGGIDPVGLFGTLLVISSCALFGCVLALTLSVWGRKTHEVLLATYVIGIVYLLIPFMLEALRWQLPGAVLPKFETMLRFNPVFLILATLDAPPGMSAINLGAQATFFGIGLAVSAMLVALSTWRIRVVVVRQMGQGERSGSRASRRRGLFGWLDRRSSPVGGMLRRSRRSSIRLLDRNPVFWRECQRRRPSWSNRFVRSVYVLLCGGFSLVAIVLMVRGNSDGRDLAVAVNIIQVAAGLLMLSVSSATSLAEERQRGSLDVLMTTPMSTRSIVLGKWRGAFRAVPPLLILPTALSLLLAMHSGRIGGVIVLAALIVSYGAAVTSLGVALATWVPRLGRAVGLSVGIYTGMTFGWLFFSVLILNGAGNSDIGFAAASPLMGVGVYSAEIADVGPDDYASLSAWLIFWTIAYTWVALGLLVLTLNTFDRCLGRIEEADAASIAPASGPPLKRWPAPTRRADPDPATPSID